MEFTGVNTRQMLTAPYTARSHKKFGDSLVPGMGIGRDMQAPAGGDSGN